MQADPTLQNKNTVWPAAWSCAIEPFIGATDHFCELDYIEMYPSSGTPGLIIAINDWNMTAQTVNGGSGYSGPGIAADALFHTWGALYIAPASNGGTGVVKRYYDNQYLTGGDTTFTATGPASPGASPANPNGTFFELSSQHLMLILSGGDDWPATFGHVAVWQ